MSRTQGQPLSEQEIQRIVKLLRETDMSLTDIARRMDRTRSVIAKINRAFDVREYDGRRSHWSPGTGNAAPSD